MRRFALLLPVLLVLACSDDATGPVAETPDPFWSGTAPAVRLTVVRDAQGRADRTALVRVEAVWDSAWTPGATDRRVGLGGEDSTMQSAVGGRWYFNMAKDSARAPFVTAGGVEFPIFERTLSVEIAVYCPNRYDSTQISAILIQDAMKSDVKWKQPSVWIHCKD